MQTDETNTAVKKRKNKGKYFAMVDDEDYEWLSRFNWHVKKTRWTNYAARNTERDKITRKQKSIKMHREILGIVDSNIDGDHIDFNGFNNQRNNLRVSTEAQNACHTRSRVGSTSKFKGVCWREMDKKWYAQISINKKVIHIGRYDSQEEAARAYDRKAIELHGEFAVLNFPN